MLVAPIPAARPARRSGVRLVLRTGLLVMAGGYAFRLAFDGSLLEVSLGYLLVQTGVAACLSGSRWPSCALGGVAGTFVVLKQAARYWPVPVDNTGGGTA